MQLLTLNLDRSPVEAVIWLKTQNEPTREISKILGVAKSIIWYILRKEWTDLLRTNKRSAQKTTKVEYNTNLYLFMKISFLISNPVEPTFLRR